MDNKKDIQKTENISHFVDKQTIKTHPFGDNKMGERAYRRSERLVAAIHLLTNHIDQNEPIRRIVRERSAMLLGDVLEIRDEMRTVGSQKVFSIEASVRHLISLVRILAVSGFVSFENADILTDALDDLGSFMETSRRSVLSESIRFSRDDLMDVRDQIREPIKDTKDTISIKDNDALKDVSTHVREVSHQKDNSMNRRMEGILEVLRVGTEMGIRDIVVNLPEYSEKMIQRELVELVALGLVKKVGLRRWSKYTLMKPSAFPLEIGDTPVSSTADLS